MLYSSVRTRAKYVELAMTGPVQLSSRSERGVHIRLVRAAMTLFMIESGNGFNGRKVVHDTTPIVARAINMALR